MMNILVAPPRRLVIFSGCAHYRSGAQIVAHGGFVREVELWARIFSEVLVVTIAGSNEPPADAIPYAEPGVSCFLLNSSGPTTGWIGKIRLVTMAAQWTAAIRPLLRRCDHVMARGPDSLGFLGGVLARMMGLPRFAKYADQWEAFPGEPIGYRLQKAFYRGSWFAGPVQIYGSPDANCPHLVPFFTSSFSEREWLQAGDRIDGREGLAPLRILFCGRFVPAKGIDVLLRAFKVVLDSGTPAELHLVGDGDEMSSLVRISQSIGIQDRVFFHGWLGRRTLSERYRQADLFVSPSRKEGFGKVIIEAMAFGLPVLATDVGVSRFLVNPPECGVLVTPDSHQRLAEELMEMSRQHGRRRLMGQAARIRSRQFLFENLELQYRKFLMSHCGIAFK